MQRWNIALVAPMLVALTCLQLLSGCIFVPIDDGRGRSGDRDERGYEREHHDEHRR